MSDKIPTQDITPKDAAQNRKSPTTGGPQGDLYAKRQHIYVKLVKGFFQKLRTGTNWLLMLGFFLVPFISWGDRQAVFFDIPSRQFHIFGTTFFPQDFMLLAWLLIILAFVLFFVTNFAGRVWCGYTCPQSVWTWLYIWVEEKTEGPPNKRKKLDKQPWGGEKVVRKTLKHFIWLIIALATAAAFVGYFSPIRELLPRFFSFDLGPWELFWIGFFTFFTYLFAGWLREQVCIYMCPYARFQGVMFDQDTLIVSYDPSRGEPRGPRKKSASLQETGLGHCIDCDLCVQVCPVGIDIRNGLQYECITCAACIDVCDQVMDKMEYPRGLIRYTTEEELNGRKTRILRPRLIGYFTVLMVMIIAFSWALSNRVPLEMDIQRDRNQLFRMTSDGLVENSYRLGITNMTQAEQTYQLRLEGAETLQLQGAERYTLAAGESRQFSIRVQADPQALPEAPAINIEFHLESEEDARLGASRESRFILRSIR
ncbi:cytochrome c oxidase accessory protein FixG [Marinospirillum celere]|uniref:Cytochrome c oxidase accessory protein FixG n=1 Tax=Marinospirillum celere TaxID=1122252 RepID=A0A1I1GVR2_9GAMM|nr:cytochrome c oxidase accessory protein CcoG [Marinospirillum celere]SFC15575.1 cytochrome c oxidase accessory protein FixG [Marinospirillum celere]